MKHLMEDLRASGPSRAQIRTGKRLAKSDGLALEKANNLTSQSIKIKVASSKSVFSVNH